MKTYKEAVTRLATHKYHKYMGGDNDTRISGVDLVAWVFSKPQSVVNRDIDVRFNILLRSK